VEGEAVLEAEEEVEVRHRRRELGDNKDCF